MDGFEPVREAAQRLHDVVIASGANPLEPIALITAAVEILDLELVWLSAGNPALKGARAIFDEQSGTICCEETGNSATNALLVAHELGHVEVHAGSTTCATVDIDPSRTSEAAPVGLQRVEDYGAHERRELQANVFAREFLLPRVRAADLHRQENLSATVISQRTGLPLDLVRQQLFDALLLPDDLPPATAAVPIYTPRPDPSQDRAVAHRGAPFLLQAGPGTGKTRTLVNRVSSLLTSGIDPASILVLTFSNRAAGELAERLTISSPEAAPRIWIGTFHAFGLDLVRRHHDRFGLSPNPTLFDRSDAIEVLEEILPTLPLVHYRNLWDPAMVLRDVVSAISRAKDELSDPVHYRALAASMLASASDDAARQAAEKCLEIALIYELYENAMKERGSVDFGDLIMRPALLLESDPELRLAVQLRHRHLLVDEYQDVNRASARLLKAIAGDGKRLWVVGDARQSIYRFRGASSANMTKFVSDYPGAIVDRLEVNYRSTKQIIDTFTAVAPRMAASAGMLPLSLEADRGNGPAKPQILRYETLAEEAGGIAASVRELEKMGVALRDQAVLCRSNRRLNEIAAALEARGIPVLHLGSFFEREEVRELLALLSLAVDPFGDALVRVGAMSRYNVPLQDVHVAMQHLRTAGRPALLGLSSLSEAEGLSPEGAIAFSVLASDLAGLSSNSPAWDFLSTYLLDRTDIARQLGAGNSVAEQMQAVAVWQFLNFVREQGSIRMGLPIQRTLDRVRQLVLLAEERDLRQVPASALHLNAVKLMTVHGSKGLEFDAVHLPGLTIQSLPAQNRGQRCPPPLGMIEGANELSVSDEAKQAHANEEECLFFVALSRARTYLRLYLARKQPNGSNRSESPYLGWIPSFCVDEIRSPAVLPLPPEAQCPQVITIKRNIAASITDSQLVAYDKCPRRFFYTHVLGLGGARKRTAFTQTHDCLYAFVRWLEVTRQTSYPTMDEAKVAFESIWREKGPVDHAFCDDYLKLASRLVEVLVRAGVGRTFSKAEPLALDFPNGRVVVEPNELAQMPNGTAVLRRVRTGQRRSDEYDRLEYSLYLLAGQAKFGKGVQVEALHLTDETAESVSITAAKLGNRSARSDDMLGRIATGWFPPQIDSVTCPRCPHFFICAATPRGSLKLP